MFLLIQSTICGGCCYFQMEKLKTYYTETLTKYLGFLEKLLSGNKDGNGYFVGDKVCFFYQPIINSWWRLIYC